MAYRRGGRRGSRPERKILGGAKFKAEYIFFNVLNMFIYIF